MKKILFVDDDPFILQALRNALRKQRHVWDMVFCNSGPHALAAMREQTFDVIVSDMRMPDMDGAELLLLVRELYPATARIVLSGQADRLMALRTLPASQQFLAKPTSTEQLIDVIDRSCKLLDLVSDQNVLQLIGGTDTLPSIPKTYTRLTELLRNTEVDFTDIAAVVESDPALSAKLLQVVNSAYFGLAKSVSSLPAAVNYVGIDLLKAMALATGVFSVADYDAMPVDYSVEQAQRHAMVVAHAARRIVTDTARRDEAFTAGVLHDIGKLVMAARLPREFARVLRDGSVGVTPVHRLEEQVFGTSHGTIGAVLLGVWGLPHNLVHTVAWHHNLSESGAADDPVTVAVHIADALASTSERGCGESDNELDIAALERCGLVGELPRYREIVAEVEREMTAGV